MRAVAPAFVIGKISFAPASLVALRKRDPERTRPCRPRAAPVVAPLGFLMGPGVAGGQRASGPARHRAVSLAVSAEVVRQRFAQDEADPAVTSRRTAT
ncbi:hypothetical protein AB0E08_17805 [Streptomyces sp. NPDC048281]|uniref:hypothetical protein n=1 Tax=Streptomyces sp. NPDC048281 TaxID=3154715 RepID=UPI00344007EB